jgi:hypothetical protein
MRGPVTVYLSFADFQGFEVITNNPEFLFKLSNFAEIQGGKMRIGQNCALFSHF